MHPQFKILGVINVTPDSFSDGGDIKNTDDCAKVANAFLQNGASYIDLGAESTRPGAEFVSVDEEWQRLEAPLLRLIQEIGAEFICVDTCKSEIIERVLNLNVAMINNIRGFDLEDCILQKIALANVKYIAMHIYKIPKNMQDDPLSGHEGFKNIKDFFLDARKRLIDVKFKHDQFYLDPGIGFGKNDSLNWSLIYRMQEFLEFGQLCVGVSRKSFLGRLFNLPTPKDRDAVSKIAELQLAAAGVNLIRTHDVKNLAELRKNIFLKD